MGKNHKSRRRKSPRLGLQRRDDAELLALGQQFDAALAKLLSLQMCDGDAEAVDRIEAFLARMEPIERAILTIPADSLAGVAVKARVAAHVASNYWDMPLDQLDLDARAFRLLVEAVCGVAGASLPFSSDPGTPMPLAGRSCASSGLRAQSRRKRLGQPLKYEHAIEVPP
jgi:hypothetical protein